jgi:lactam utilization protein B
MNRQKWEVTYGWKHGACYHESAKDEAEAKMIAEQLRKDGWADAKAAIAKATN